MDTKKILVRVFRSRGRITDRFHVGRLQRRGMTRTSPNPPVKWASPRVVSAYVKENIGAWDPSGEQGRQELADLIRRVDQP